MAFRNWIRTHWFGVHSHCIGADAFASVVDLRACRPIPIKQITFRTLIHWCMGELYGAAQQFTLSLIGVRQGKEKAEAKGETIESSVKSMPVSSSSSYFSLVPVANLWTRLCTATICCCMKLAAGGFSLQRHRVDCAAALWRSMCGAFRHKSKKHRWRLRDGLVH